MNATRIPDRISESLKGAADATLEQMLRSANISCLRAALYQKVRQTQSDKQWSEIQGAIPGTGGDVLIFNQESQPTPPQGQPAIWWKPIPADNRMEWWVWQRYGTGEWRWTFYGKSPVAPN